MNLKFFGQFTNRELELKPGLNLIYGENEAGKSTIHTFIKGMLFGIERLRGRGAASKEDVYRRYLPWDYPGAYAGSMDIRLGDKEYRLERSFHASDKGFTITELSTGREVKLREGQIGELIPGLTESTYKNTISIEQLKAATDTELADQVRNYITNLSIAKSKEINVARAVADLNDLRKQLEASQNVEALKTLQAAIEEGVEREERLDALSVRLHALLAERQKLILLKKQLTDACEDETIGRMEQLPAVLEKYRNFQAFMREEKILEEEAARLKDELVIREKRHQEADNIAEQLQKLKQLQEELNELDKTALQRKEEKARLNNRAGMNAAVSVLPAVILAFTIWGLMGFKTEAMLPFSIVMAAGVAGFIVLQLLKARQQKAFRIRRTQEDENRTLLILEYQNILKTSGVADAQELSLKQEEVIRNAYALEQALMQEEALKKRCTELEDDRDMLYEEIMRYQQNFIQVEELTDASIAQLKEVIEVKRRESVNGQTRINEQLEENRLSAEKLRWEISTLEKNEEELIKNRESYQEMERKQKEIATELEAVKLAISVIGELSADIHDSFGQQLNAKVTEIIRNITGNKYSNLKVNEKLEVKVDFHGTYVSLDCLSAGTIDQIYFALRTAVAELLLGQDEVPLLLDDSFALYDEPRVRACLKELSCRKQVILFTCHKRERQLLDELGVAYHFVELSQE